MMQIKLPGRQKTAIRIQSPASQQRWQCIIYAFLKPQENALPVFITRKAAFISAVSMAAHTDTALALEK